MKISIVTISFNQKDYLKYCIDSILSQPDEIELIIVDAGSTDGSRDLIDSYGDRVIKIYESDQGPADGLNKGFKLATGDIYGFINSDDGLVPNCSSQIIKFFTSDDKVSAISGSGYFIDQNSEIIGQTATSKITPMLFALDAVTLFQQSTFFRKEAFNLVGGFNKLNKTCWDAELFIDMAKKGIKFKLVNTKIGFFRLHTESITVSGKFEKQLKIDLALINSDFNNPLVKFLKNFKSSIKFICDPFYIIRKGCLKRDPFKRFKKNG
ncbi:glycosyltransferase [Acinetobacter sp. ANC 5380]|uniref:Glycosyltransferase n=1 Tax=Acinetobacter terrae TaxID=2731247 RepID=A0A7Y2WA18_9GAMM|nr:glycosyltransferase [Acinetobacter terrae]NNH76956.1 glycosyltransferase [Acinetobacter terrae]